MFQSKISKDIFFHDLKDKTFVLTGYSSGIGEEVFNYLSLLKSFKSTSYLKVGLG